MPPIHSKSSSNLCDLSWITFRNPDNKFPLLEVFHHFYLRLRFSYSWLISTGSAIRVRENQVQDGICSPKVNSKAQLLTSSSSSRPAGRAGHLTEHRRSEGEAFARTRCGTAPVLWAGKTSLEILPDIAEHWPGGAMWTASSKNQFCHNEISLHTH